MPDSVLGTGEKIMNKREISQGLFSPNTGWWLSSNDSDCNGGDAGDAGLTQGGEGPPGEGNVKSSISLYVYYFFADSSIWFSHLHLP